MVLNAVEAYYYIKLILRRYFSRGIRKGVLAVPLKGLQVKTLQSVTHQNTTGL